jgi:hypothetical protein
VQVSEWLGFPASKTLGNIPFQKTTVKLTKNEWLINVLLLYNESQFSLFGMVFDK